MRTINSKVSLALLAIFSMAIFACQSEKEETKSPKEVATGFLDKMTAGDIVGAKEYATSASAQALDMMADMGDTWEGMSYEIAEVNKTDSTATVQYKLDGEDHMLDMTMEDGKWKVEYAFMMPGEGDMGDDMMDDDEDGDMKVGDAEGEKAKDKENDQLTPTDQKSGDVKVDDRKVKDTKKDDSKVNQQSGGLGGGL